MLQEQQPVEVFCVAAPEDAALLTQWEECLLPLREEGYLTFWPEMHPTDDCVPGQEESFAHFLRADLIILLISASFFEAPECLTYLEQALHRADKAVQIVLLVLWPVDGHEELLTSHICLPSNGLPVTAWDDADAAFRDCQRSIFLLLDQPLSRFSPEPQQEEARSDLQGKAQTHKALFWSWKRTLSSLPGSLLISMTASLGVVFLYGLLIWLSDGLAYALIIALPTALPIGLITGVLGTVFGSAIYGFFQKKPVEQPIPSGNQGE